MSVDKEKILQHVRKLEGTNYGLLEQFPEEIQERRKKLVPEMKKAKASEKKAKLTGDRLVIDGRTIKAESGTLPKDINVKVSDIALKLKVKHTDILTENGRPE